LVVVDLDGDTTQRRDAKESALLLITGLLETKSLCHPETSGRTSDKTANSLSSECSKLGGGDEGTGDDEGGGVREGDFESGMERESRSVFNV